MESNSSVTQTQESEETTVDQTANNSEMSRESLVFGRSEYARKDFWNERFATSKGFFDWYLEYKELKAYFEKVYPLKKESSILMVGCGNSKLSEQMYEDGYKNITNIDISSVVIENMKKYYETKGITIECLEMDATNMTFPEGTFDVVIDKGTLDALMCAKDNLIVSNLIREMTRVLKINGELFIISHGSPTSRKELFKNAVDLKKFEFLYSEQKLSDVSQLINIFRSKLKDKPLSHIFKDKELLKQSVEEFNAMKKKTSLASRLLQLKMAIEKKKAEEKQQKDDEGSTEVKETENTEKKEVVENKEEKEPIQTNNQEIKETEQKPNTGTEETQKSEEIQETKVETKPENSGEEKEKSAYEEEKDTKSMTDSEYNPQRQSHCYIYYVKKIAS